MGRQIKRWILFSILLVLSGIMTGCGDMDGSSVDPADRYTQELDREAPLLDRTKEKTDRIYQDTLDRVYQKKETFKAEGKNAFERATYFLLSGFQSVYLSIRALAVYLGVASFSIGLCIFLFASKNKAMKKTGLVTFMIAVPVFLLLFVYGFGILAGILMG